MKNKWLLVLLAGLLLLVIAMPVSDKKNQETKEELTKSDTGGKEKYEDYAEKAASELEKVISRMEGAGKVKVMMTVSSSSEKVVERMRRRWRMRNKEQKRDDRLRRDDGGTDALCQKGACPHCGRSGSSL